MGTKKQELAYQLYNSLGSERNYGKVAELLGLSVKTIELWGSKYGWQERLEQEQKEKAEKLKQKREELECLGFEVALDALKEVQAQVKDKKLSKDLASIYETFLSCPLTLMGTSEKEKTEEKEVGTSELLQPPGVYIVKPEDIEGEGDRGD